MWEPVRSDGDAIIGLAALAQAMGVELSNKELAKLADGPLRGRSVSDVEAARAAIRAFAARKAEVKDG